MAVEWHEWVGGKGASTWILEITHIGSIEIMPINTKAIYRLFWTDTQYRSQSLGYFLNRDNLDNFPLTEEGLIQAKEASIKALKEELEKILKELSDDGS